MYTVTIAQRGTEGIDPTVCATLKYARKLAAEVARDEKQTYRGSGYVYRVQRGSALDSSVVERRVFAHPVFGTDTAITIRRK